MDKKTYTIVYKVYVEVEATDEVEAGDSKEVALLEKALDKLDFAVDYSCDDIIEEE